MRTQDVPVQDYHLIVEKPDSSFSPQRNKALVEETLRETDTFFQSLHEARDKEWELRKDVLMSYGDYRLNRGGTKRFEEYVGRDLRRTLIGEQLLSKVSVLSSVDKLKGKQKRVLL